MYSLSIKKYKDDVPLNTINKIRNILNGLGILAIETGWQNSAEGYFSVNLMIQNTNLFTNGKGTTYEYALASAYGELMERLQNQSFFRLNKDLRPEALNYQDFYYTPDEKQLSIKEILRINDDWLKLQFSKISTKINKRELLEKWKLVSYEDVPCDFVALPYVNLINDSISYIPMKMVSKMYMSNGMCAGNTLEEALIQGISELMERYVNKKIIRDKITPPSIPREYIKNFPKIDDMIEKIESSGNFVVILKDCSLDEGYPVVGAIFINKEDQSYFIKFGAHPIFDIAAERTLTELLQGQDVKNMRGVKEYSYKPLIDNEHANLIGILVNGSGLYPREIFYKNPSYPFSEPIDVSYLNNKDMLTYLLQFLKLKGFNIFVRDVSYLGFPSFHAIIPGLSEIDEFDDIASIESYAKYNNIKKKIRNLSGTSKHEIEEISQFIKTNYGTKSSITQFLNLPTNNTFPWYYVNIDLFFTALYYKHGDYEKSLTHFNNFLNDLELNQYNQNIYTFYKCVKDYLGTRIDNLNEQDTYANLSTFYPLVMIQEVIKQFVSPEQIFSFGEINCWNCDSCQLKQLCMYISEENVYRKLKEKYAQSNINQSHLIGLFTKI